MSAPWRHNELVKLGRAWLHARGYKVVLAERGHFYGDCLPDLLAWSSTVYGVRSILIEVKISRGDFRADRKKPIHSHPEHYPGQERVYLAPAGLVKVEELPAGWGLLAPRPNRMGCTVVKRGELGPATRRIAETPYLLAALRRYELGLEPRADVENVELPPNLAELPEDVRLELLAERARREQDRAERDALALAEQAEEEAHQVAEGARPLQQRLF